MIGDNIFPTYEAGKVQYETGIPEAYHPDGGLSKRELFAAMALQGLISRETYNVLVNDEGYISMPISLSQKAIQYADALIKELEKPNDEP